VPLFRALPLLPLLLGAAVPPGTGAALGLVPGAAAGPAAAPAPGSGVWPLSPRPPVHERFAPPEQRWQAGHRGVDLAGRPGQGVLASLDGRVRFAGRIGGKPVVVVGHGTTRTTYEPVAAVVEVGDRVTAGQRIGVLTVPFSHCLPAACLHWGLRRGAAYLDPLVLVGAVPVRLLPPDGGQARGWAWR
jgi:murein DD-endopeptidase MepM/ murein hydrolase activator NlpD